MKAIICMTIVMAAALATALTTSTGTLTMDFYKEDNCAGGVLHTVSPKLGTCEKRGHHGPPSGAAQRFEPPESFMDTVPVMGDVARLAQSTGTNCSHSEFTESVVCNRCSPFGRSGKYFQLHCSVSGQYATFSTDCDEGCTTCQHDQSKMMVGSCHADRRNSTHEVKLVSITKAYTFQSKAWSNSTTCSGTASFEETHATGFCDFRVKFTYSP